MKPNIKDALAGLESLKPEGQLKIERDPNLEHVVSELRRIFVAEHGEIGGTSVYEHDFQNALGLLSGLDITPSAIEVFCYDLKAHEAQDQFVYNAGLIIGLAVQASFNLGYNKFYLPVGHFEPELEYLCNHLSGKKDRRLELTIEGNFNRSLSKVSFLNILMKGNVIFVADQAKNCEIELIGNVGNRYVIGSGMMSIKNSKVKINGDVLGTLFGSQADSSVFEITGRSGKNCGAFTKNSKFIFHKNAGESSAQFSHDCEYIILGWDNDWRIGSGAYNCKFRCKSEATIEELKKSLPDKTLGRPQNNKIYRINPDGSETLVIEI